MFRNTCVMNADSCGVDKSKENTKEKMLYWAVMSKHDKCIEVLLRTGADVNWVDDSSFTLLIRAAENGYVHGVEKLIQAGADVNKRSEERLHSTDTSRVHWA